MRLKNSDGASKRERWTLPWAVAVEGVGKGKERKGNGEGLAESIMVSCCEVVDIHLPPT